MLNIYLNQYLYNDSVEVQLIVLSGQAPAQTIEKIRFPFPYSGYIVLDLPSLTHPKRYTKCIYFYIKYTIRCYKTFENR